MKFRGGRGGGVLTVKITGLQPSFCQIDIREFTRSNHSLEQIQKLEGILVCGLVLKVGIVRD